MKSPLSAGVAGAENVVLTDIRNDVNRPLIEGGPYLVDARDGKAIDEIVRRHKIDTIYHLAALLSARAEQDPWGHGTSTSTA